MFRFTIRDVLWLTVVVALGVAWWLDRTILTTGNSELVKQRTNELRFAKLRALELDRKAIIHPY
jgi:hypothetical protein